MLLLLFLIGSALAQLPNIVWIMSDDLGWGEVGVYPAGSAHGRIATPNLDKFASLGMKFTNAYAGYTVCAPSRAAFFTGRNSGHFQKGNLHPSGNWTLLPEILKAKGYNTAVIGKSAPLNLPTTHGFDYYWGQHDQGACHNMYPKEVELADKPNVKHNTPVPLPLNHKEKNRQLCMANPDAYNYTTNAFHDQAMAWLGKQEGSKNPFFLYMAYTVPHAGGWGDSPQDPEQGNPVPSDLQYANKNWPDVEKDHAASVTHMDKLVGEIMDKLTSIGAAENTLVFFASDNGAHNEGGHNHLFFNSTGGLRGFKRSYYEGGIRSPTMVVWPSVVPRGSVSNTTWAFWDVIPTVCDIIGVPIPKSAIDGRSILPTLQGKHQPDPEYQYWTWTGTKSSKPHLHAVVDPLAAGAPEASSGYCTRVGKWKAVVHACADAEKLKPSKNDKMELYDLNDDPFEKVNIATRHPNVVASIKDLLMKKDLSCECYQC